MRSSLAGPEALVQVDLEKNLILNSNRLRTSEDARLELVTYVEAKFGLRIRDSTPSDTDSRGHSDPMDADAVNSASSGKGSVGWVFQVRWSTSSTRLQCTQEHRQAIVWQRQTEQSWSKSEAKERVKRTREIPKEIPKEPKVPEAHTRVNHRTLVSQVLKI